MTGPKKFDRKQGFLTRVLSSMNFLVSEDTGTRDMRAYARIECNAEVVYVDEKGATARGLLVDVSRTGLQLETERKLRKGLTLALNAPEQENLSQEPPFMANVKWCRKVSNGKYRVGLALPPAVVDDLHWLEALLDELGYETDDR